MNPSRATIPPAFLTLACAGAFVLLAGQEGGDTSSSESAESQVRPLELGKLLAVLPACPEEWTLKRSRARTLYLENLEAYAMREYEKVVPEEETKKGAEKPETVILAVRDTCGAGPHIRLFQEETAPPPGGDFKLGAWGNHPAMLVSLGDARRALRILVNDRFVVEVVFAGDNRDALQSWMAGCNLDPLIEADNDRRITIRDRVWLRFLDEINPDRSRRYPVPVHTEGTDESDLNPDPTIPPNMEERKEIEEEVPP